MSKTMITRRSALALGAAGAAGLAAACTTQAAPVPRYDGQARFAHGVASGDPTSSSVVIWTRVSVEAGTVPVRWRVARDEAFADIVAEGQATTSELSDHTIKVDVTGLEAGQAFFYQFDLITPDGPLASPVGRTRTAPKGGMAPFRFAFVSCSNYPAGYFNVYRDIAARDDIQAVIHLGDYFYEYGPGGYATQFGAQVGRIPEPPKETVTLEDYRLRHAQYKSDPDLQAAHGAFPWFCTWDDHESTNDANATGAENHDPDMGEGEWTDRKAAAVRAYLEWMPVRDPEAGRAREALWRQMDWGQVASIHLLETRLTGRSEEISYDSAFQAGPDPMAIAAAATELYRQTLSEERTMMGAAQEAWLADGLKAAVGRGQRWQLLGNQTVMARVVAPPLAEMLSDAQRAALYAEVPFVEPYIEFTRLGLPMNPDAWDGFAAARERLFAAAASANADLVVITGDTHTAWANQLHDASGARRGVEFGCTSVSSPGLGDILPMIDGLGEMFAAANEDVVWHDPNGRGYTVVTLTETEAKAEFIKVSTVFEQAYTTETVATFTVAKDGAGPGELVRA